MILLSEIINWAGSAILLVGVVVALIGFRKSRKTGYILIAAAFLLSLIATLIISPINKAQQRKHRQNANSNVADIENEIQEAMMETHEQVLKKHGRPNPAPYATMNISYKVPLFEILLISGLWLLVKKESI
jgi:uncharacterized membrane protein